MKRSLVLALVFLSAHSATADVRRRAGSPVSVTQTPPAIPVSDVVHAPSRGADRSPRLAAGPSQALLVWHGGKASRISPTGEVLDIPPIQLPGEIIAHDVAWDGSRYVIGAVAWDGRRLVMRIITVTTTGRIELVNDVETIEPNSQLAISANDAGIVVVRSLGHSDPVIDAVILERDGRVFKRFNLARETAGHVRLAAGGNDFLALWQSGAAIIEGRGDRVRPVAISSGAGAEVTWNGTAWVVVQSVQSGLALMHIRIDGRVGRIDSLRISPHGAAFPSIAWNGSEYLVIWKEQTSATTMFSNPTHDTMVARLDPPGRILEEAIVDKATDVTGRFAVGLDITAATAIGSTVLLSWTSNLAPSIETRDVFVTAAHRGEGLQRAVDDVRLVSAKAAGQFEARIAPRPDGSVRVAWGESRDLPCCTILTSEVTASSRRGPATQLSPKGTDVHVAWTGLDTLAVWRQGEGEIGIVGQRIATNGALIESEPFTITPRDAAPLGLECGDNTCVLAWWRWDETRERSNFVTRINNGVPAAAEPLPIPDHFYDLSVRADDYLVVFGNPTATRMELRAMILGSDAIDIGEVPPGAGASAASNHDGWLVVFDKQLADGRFAIGTARVTLDGLLILGADFPVTGGPVSPKVAWDGRDWVVAWTDTGPALRDVYYMRLGQGRRLHLAASGEDEVLSDIASSGGGITALAFSRTERAHDGAWRGYVRFVKE